MINSLTALAIFALLGAAVVALPGFAPQVEARESVGLAKGDRLADPTGRPKLFATGLAQLRYALFAQQRARRDDSRSPFGDCWPLSEPVREITT
jgi:hypothetical protein